MLRTENRYNTLAEQIQRANAIGKYLKNGGKVTKCPKRHART